MKWKSCQYQYYKMGEMGKHEIGKYRMSVYGYLVAFGNDCQCRNVVSQLMFKI